MLGFAHFALVLGQQAISLPTPHAQVLLAPAAPSAPQEPIKPALAPAAAPGQAYLGISVSSGQGGVRIDSVTAGSPAEACGLEPGDVILSLAGRNVQSPDEVVAAVSARAPGSELAIEVQREGRRMVLLARLSTLKDRSPASTAPAPARAPRPPQAADFSPEATQESAREIAREARARARESRQSAERELNRALAGLGGDLQELRELQLDPQGLAFGEQRPMLGVVLEDHEEGGARIDSVVEDSGAERAGLEPGDRVIAVDGAAVVTAEELRAAIRSGQVGDRLRLEVQRGANLLQIDAELGAASGAALAPATAGQALEREIELEFGQPAEGFWSFSLPPEGMGEAEEQDEDRSEDWAESLAEELEREAEVWAERWQEEMERFSSEFESSLERWQDEFDAWFEEFQGQLEARLEGRASGRSRPAPRPPRLERHTFAWPQGGVRAPGLELPSEAVPGQAWRQEIRIGSDGRPEVQVWSGRIGADGQLEWESRPDSKVEMGQRRIRLLAPGSAPGSHSGHGADPERAALEAEIRALRAELEALRAERRAQGGR